MALLARITDPGGADGTTLLLGGDSTGPDGPGIRTTVAAEADTP